MISGPRRFWLSNKPNPTQYISRLLHSYLAYCVWNVGNHNHHITPDQGSLHVQQEHQRVAYLPKNSAAATKTWAIRSLIPKYHIHSRRIALNGGDQKTCVIIITCKSLNSCCSAVLSGSIGGSGFISLTVEDNGRIFSSSSQKRHAEQPPKDSINLRLREGMVWVLSFLSKITQDAIKQYLRTVTMFSRTYVPFIESRNDVRMGLGT